MTATTFKAETALQWLQNAAESFAQHKDELTELDAAIGDADHGANMNRGFHAVQGKLESLKDKDLGTIFKTTAMTLISTVGGASGPLYGTLFLQTVPGANGKSELSHGEFAQVLQSGLDGLMHRGKATVGEKTMIDALVPALKAFQPVENDSLLAAIDRAVAAATTGADSTVPLVATKGRASYLGERSAGHMDPGARSTVLLLEALQKALHSAV